MTIKDIAAHCNVSPGTVSNVLNGKANVGEGTRQKILDYIDEIGYTRNYFAQSMRSQDAANKLISIVAEGLSVFGTNQIIESIMSHCEENEYRTILMNMGLYYKWNHTWFDDKEKLSGSLNPILQEARAIRVSGIIYVAGHHRVIDSIPHDYPIPTVIAYGLSPENRFSTVIIDDEGAGYNAAEYLVKHGHRKIGVVAGSEDNRHTVYRLLGFKKALRDSGVTIDKSMIYYGDWRRPSGYKGAAYLSGTDITAVFCLNDEMAAGVYDYFNEKKMVIGKDISVMGFDNMELSEYLRPQLTTNEIQLYSIGHKAADVMIRMLKANKEDDAPIKPQSYKIPCNLIERGSVATL